MAMACDALMEYEAGLPGQAPGGSTAVRKILESLVVSLVPNGPAWSTVQVTQSAWAASGEKAATQTNMDTTNIIFLLFIYASFDGLWLP